MKFYLKKKDNKILKKKDNKIKAKYKCNNESGEVPDSDGRAVQLDVAYEETLYICRYEKIDDMKIPVNSSLTITLNCKINKIEISKSNECWQLTPTGHNGVEGNGEEPAVNVEIGGV